GFKDQDAEDPAAIRRFALPGSPAATGPDDPDRADASRTALQQGPVTVQVEEVAVAPVQGPAEGAKKGKAEVCLVTLLRIHKTPDPAASAAKLPADVTALQERHRPTLTDAAGKVYALLDVQAGGAGQKSRDVSAFGLVSRV